MAAIDEVTEQTHKGPVERTQALRFTLAFLGNFAEERWPFDHFWKAIVLQKDNERWASTIAARNGIHRQVTGRAPKD